MDYILFQKVICFQNTVDTKCYLQSFNVHLKLLLFLGGNPPPPPQLASSSISAINTLILLQIGLSVTHDEQNIIHEEKTNVMVDKGNKSELGKLCWQFL